MEDDFTDSDTVDYSLDVCIYFRPWSTHMSHSLLRSLLTPLHIPARQSDWNTGDDHNSVSGRYPGSFIWWCRYLAINRRCLHPAQYCSKSSKIIRQTLRCIPSYSKLIKPRSLPCSKSSNSPPQEDTHPLSSRRG